MAWLLVSTSVKEGWGLVAIEANACGTPVVCYQISGLKDSVINNQTGLIVQKNNPDFLTKTALQLIKDKNFRIKLSKQALQYSRQFSWNKSAKKALQILKEINE